MNAATHVIPPAPLFYRHLQMSLSWALKSSFQNYETNVILSQDCIEELSWWVTNMGRWNGKALLKKEFNLKIDSGYDASLTGWGLVCSHPWRSMVSDGEDDAHKLFGAAGCNSLTSSSNVC